MKIKSVTIQGFRGFNEERTIDFHDCITLIYAPKYLAALFLELKLLFQERTETLKLLVKILLS